MVAGRCLNQLITKARAPSDSEIGTRNFDDRCLRDVRGLISVDG